MSVHKSACDRSRHRVRAALCVSTLRAPPIRPKHAACLVATVAVADVVTAVVVVVLALALAGAAVWPS
eukprot:4620186-Pyramimonas_sp.AAC.1